MHINSLVLKKLFHVLKSKVPASSKQAKKIKNIKLKKKYCDEC